jgi:hypothetical protein
MAATEIAELLNELIDKTYPMVNAETGIRVNGITDVEIEWFKHEVAARG